MTSDPFAEVLEVSLRKDLSEVGGAHNQKGIDFQRCWAVMRMFELEQSGAKDFLLLFEAIQDVAILDSGDSPTSICIYQIKKKDRKEWAWGDLTDLHAPSNPLGKPPKVLAKVAIAKPLSAIKGSPLGKLYATVRAFKKLNSAGRFVSNAGCDLPLANGGNAATSLPVALSTLSQAQFDLLTKGLETFHDAGEKLPDLSRIHLERVVLPVDDPSTHVVGIVHKFLDQRSPRHAGQARSLVDSLLAKIGPLGSKTDSYKDFAELRKQRGYCKSEFVDALASLETIPDQTAQLETWLTQLQSEGMGFMEIASIRSHAAAIFRRQVMGARSTEEDQI
jgi:hypothetical protein